MEGSGEDHAFHLPDAVQHIRTGSVLDVLPILSLTACLPTLRLFLMSRRRSDLFIYSAGLLVAILYHFLQVHKPGGLGEARWLGLPGAGWRIVDIIFANLMLARSTVHILGINHPYIASLPNVVLPCSLLGLLVTKPSSAGLQRFTVYTGTCVVLTIALQLLVDARAIVRHAVTHYSPGVMARTVLFCALGFSCFVVPVKYPGDYWFWHSAWHVCMGLAYFEVYAALCGLPGGGGGVMRARGRAVVQALLGGKPRHWMAASRSQGAASLQQQASLNDLTNTNPSDHLGSADMPLTPALQPALAAPASNGPAHEAGLGGGRRGRGRHSVAVPGLQVAAVPSTPGRQSRGRGLNGEGGALEGEEAAEAVLSDAIGEGVGRATQAPGSRGRKVAAAVAMEGITAATPTPLRRGPEEGGVLDVEPGSIAKRVRARRRRSGSAGLAQQQ